MVVVSIFHAQWYCIEHELLLSRFKHVKTGYHIDLSCMEGTRRSLLNQIMDWAADDSTQGAGSNTFWVYGPPGIGKTSLAHSICARLHQRNHFAGAFFCQRDDPHLSNPGNILLTFIHNLTRKLPPFRSIVARQLRNNPETTLTSMAEALLHDFLHSLPRQPKRTLVFVIDALDECGDTRSRPAILKALTDAAAQAPWMRIIITSRPEADIARFFDTHAHSSHLRYDLGVDHEASTDLRIFAQVEFDWVARQRRLSTPWPEESVFDQVISRANGLFIFIKTVALALAHLDNPTWSLNAILEYSAGAGSSSLYGLYTGILQSRIPPSNGEFRQVIGVIFATAPYRSLRTETMAELVGVRPEMVRKWVDDLHSLLYRDEGANGAIRVRHSSISEFFISEECPYDYRVNPKQANIQLGVACLTTMVDQLCFNICKLEDSRLANTDIEDLHSRIERNISDALQYSCLNWSNHLCSNFKNDDQRGQEQLKKFFEGCYPLFWIEVLSLMGMVSISIPTLQRVILTWVKASTAPAWSLLGYSNVLLGQRCDASRENRRDSSFHHDLPSSYLPEHSAHLSFNATVPTLTVALVDSLH